MRNAGRAYALIAGYYSKLFVEASPWSRESEDFGMYFILGITEHHLS